MSVQHSHVITFYTDQHDKWVTRMINLGFSPMMATAKKNPYYFKTFTGVFRFWSFNYQDWTGNYDEVDLCIGAPDNYRTDWDGVKRWLRGDSEELPLMKTMKCVAEQTDLYDQRIKEELEHASTDYKYEERVCDGIFFAEIRKPEVGQVEVTPYTVVIEAWTPDKMPYMFSSICSVPSFGKSGVKTNLQEPCIPQTGIL